MHRKLWIVSLMLFMILGFIQTVFGFEESKATIFGAKIGVLLPGEYAIGDADIETDAGFHGGIFLDQQLAPKLYGGVFVDISSASASEADATGTRFDIGFTLKGHFPHQASHLTFRPGIGFGYGYGTGVFLERCRDGFSCQAMMVNLVSFCPYFGDGRLI